MYSLPNSFKLNCLKWACYLWALLKTSFTCSVMEWSTTNPKMVLNIAYTRDKNKLTWEIWQKVCLDWTDAVYFFCHPFRLQPVADIGFFNFFLAFYEDYLIIISY